MALEIIDRKLNENGELVFLDIKTVKKVTAEKFCQVYLEDNEEFHKLSQSEYRVLSMCWRYSIYYSDLNYPGNKVTYDKQFKDLIKSKTDLADSTIKNAFNTLVKKEMLIKDKDYKGIYYMNPKHFFKGSISDRAKVIKHTIEYELKPNNEFYNEG